MPRRKVRATNRARLNVLRAAQEANAAAYRHAVQTSAAGECWDYLVLTAANEKQAEGYRQEFALRSRAVGPAGSFFPQIQRTLVVPDPPGRKAGSGGATLGAVRALLREFKLDTSDLERLRVLLIHSGGMSQRLPMYSALGKIFSPLPLLRPDGQIATLFDHLYITLAGLPPRLGPGMLVLAGDVFLVFDHRQVTAPPPGVTAISMRVEPELGRGHGVFVAGEGGTIARTLQKVSVEEMKAAGATDAAGRVLIDTGLLFFDPPRARALSDLSRRLRADGEIDLYDDMTAALAAGTDADEYLRGGRSRPIRQRLWKSLHGVPFRVMQVDGEFLHLGTTRQFRDAMIGRDPSPAAALFQQNVLAHSEWDVPPDCRVYQSVLASGLNDSGDGRGALGRGSVIEHSILVAPSTVGSGSVVSQVVVEEGPIDLGDDLLLFQVPLRNERGDLECAHVVCGVDDDFKGRYLDSACTYLNRPIDEWLLRHRISPEEIWPEVDAGGRTLWNARLIPATLSRDHARAALPLASRRGAKAAELHVWRKLPRYSMAEILARADPSGLIEHREAVSARLQTRGAIDSIGDGDNRPADALIGHFTTAAAYGESEFALRLWGVGGAPERGIMGFVDRARAFWTASQLVCRPGHPDPHARGRADEYMRLAFAKVAEASELGQYASRAVPQRPARLRPRVEVVAAAPARLDLAGGWSDTPPYCFERGGHVVNVAIDLDGRPPVTAAVRTLAEPVLVLESLDLGRKVELSDGEVAGGADVGDAFALHKVALRTAGLLTEGESLRKQLKSLGVGLHVTTEARVPKGSGLGTSSILAATLLAALHAVAGRKPSAPRLIEQTLLLEQRLGTGGGWQDQVGGVAPGVKSTVSRPGIPQRPKVEVLKLSQSRLDALQERLVVYYSGQQRLARDILRQVMGRWLAREPAVVGLMSSLKESAASLRTALLRGNWPAAAEQVNRYWRTKKELYPGSATPAIDQLLLETKDDYLAAALAGAGGGGFAYFLCRDGRQASRLRAKLAERSATPGSPGRVYPATINRQGLTVRRR